MEEYLQRKRKRIFSLTVLYHDNNFQIVVNLPTHMGKVLCPVCKTMVDAANHNPKHLNKAGNPLSPADNTIGTKFWSA
jgi:hypothetical protein